MATFPPTECLTAPALYFSRADHGRNGPHATPVPFVMPSGTRASSVPGPVHNPSARDRGQQLVKAPEGIIVGRLLDTFNKEIARTPSKLTRRARQLDDKLVHPARSDTRAFVGRAGLFSFERLEHFPITLKRVPHHLFPPGRGEGLLQARQSWTE